MDEPEVNPEIGCEWGSEGLERALSRGDAVVIVDVLSFSTSVDIAVSRGAAVYPCDMRGDSAQQYAKSVNAMLASPARSLSSYSLSPVSLQNIQMGTRIVLGSPNGSRLSNLAGNSFIGCLRNARAAAAKVQQISPRVTIVPAGEQWEDGTMRVAVEDLLGAGAIISFTRGTRSLEADAAAAVFGKFADDLLMALRECVSGRELIERGFARDVELAAQLNVSECVPVLRDGAFIAAN